MMRNFLHSKTPLIFAGFIWLLTGCVTQSFENDNTTPVVKNDSTNNDIAMTRISLGLGYLKMGNTTQAKLNLEKAKKFSPQLVQVHTAFAHYYDVVGEPLLATDAYEEALSIDGSDPDTLNNYGVFLCRHEKYQAAEKYTLKAISIPTYLMVSQSYENLALCQLKAKEFTKAEKYFTKSIQHSPNRASALLQMVRLQYAFSDYKTAQKYLHRYEKSTRRFSPDALALAYKVFKKQHNRRVAKNYASMLVKMFPNSYQAKQYILNELARIEADDLAETYQRSIIGTDKEKPKKRVVVLSPKKEQSLPSMATKKGTVKSIVSEPLLKEENNIKPKSKVPTKNSEALAIPEESVSKKTIYKAPLAVAPSMKGELIKQVKLPKKHKVIAGENLFSISIKYNVHMKTLEQWNDFSRDNVLGIGDIVYIEDPKKPLSDQR
jgi:type IV pilus assembly protein PilF